MGACNDKGYRSTYSQYGAGLDVAAPSNDLAVQDATVVRLDLDEADFRVRARGGGAPGPSERRSASAEVNRAIRSSLQRRRSRPVVGRVAATAPMEPRTFRSAVDRDHRPHRRLRLQ